MDIHFHFKLLSSIFITLLYILFVVIAIFFLLFVYSIIAQAGRLAIVFFQDDTFIIKSSIIIPCNQLYLSRVTHDSISTEKLVALGPKLYGKNSIYLYKLYFNMDGDCCLCPPTRSWKLPLL